MYKIKILFALCFCISLSCKKTATLPAQTAAGSNNFGCYINGILFTPLNTSTGNALTNNEALSLTYGQLIEVGSESSNQSEKYIFRVEANRWENGIKKSIGISALNIEKLKTGNSFVINNTAGNFAASYKEEKGNNLQIFTAYEGAINILKITDSFIAGTFWFTTRDIQNNTLEITSGRFDVSFPRRVYSY